MEQLIFVAFAFECPECQHGDFYYMPSPNVVASSDYGPIIVNAHDTVVGRNILRTGSWEKNELGLMIKLLEILFKKKERLIAYDVGANIGIHSLALAQYFGTHIKIRAFEAQRPLYHMLCGTLALNNILSVTAYHKAISDRTGDTITITLPDYNLPNNFGGFEVVPPRLSDNQSMIQSHSEVVKTMALDNFDEAVDFIKMDIEGMEDQALRGAYRLFEKYLPIVFIEILKTDRDFVLDFFKSRRYRGFQAGGNLLALPHNFPVPVQGLNALF